VSLRGGRLPPEGEVLRMSSAISALPLKPDTTPALPADSDAAIVFGGFAFADGAPPAGPGVLAVALPLQGRLYPLLIEAAEDLSAAAAAAVAKTPPLPHALRVVWLARAQARQRAHIARDLARKYNPPLEAEHRTAAAAAEIAELAPDLAADRFPPAPADDGAPIDESALRSLVESFYAAGKRDPLLAPIFSTAIGDWDRHISLIADFWSRALTGTTRYQGFPYSAHIGMQLTPEHFERWVALFSEAAERDLPPAAAARAIAKASSMSRCFQAGLCPVARSA
jgi:hemoglobin